MKKLALTLLVAALLVMPAYGHNTNTTHTRLTESALVVVEAAAASNPDTAQQDAYAELARDNYVVWGTDPKYKEQDSLDTDIDDFSEPPYSVMAGAVLEDAPFTRVTTHFYYAYTGQGSHPQVKAISGDEHDSEVVAHRYFDQAIEAFGYELDEGQYGDIQFVGTEPLPVTLRAAPANELGLFLFGHALHHVEDMSSVAHSQNDAHLTMGRERDYNNERYLGIAEVDDYEASYIPSLLWDANDPRSLFGLATTQLQNLFPKRGEPTALRPAMINSFTDIWGLGDFPGGLELGPNNELINPAAGLGRSVVNLSVFSGWHDQEMMDELVPDPDALGCIEETTTKQARIGGEIVEMFGTADTDEASCQIFFDFDISTGNFGIKITDLAIIVDGAPATSPGPGLFFSHGTPFWIIYAFTDLPGFFIPEESWWPLRLRGGPLDQINGEDYYYFEQIMAGIVRGEEFDPTLLVRPAHRRADMLRAYDPANGNGVVDSPDVIEFSKSQPQALASFYAENLIPLAIEYAAGYTELWYDIANHPPYLKHVTVKQDSASEDDKIRYEALWTDIENVRVMEHINENGSGEAKLPFNYVEERNLSITAIGHIDPEQPFTVILEFNEPVQKENGDQEIKLFLNGTEITYSSFRSTPSPTGDPWYGNREFEMTIDNLAADFPGALPEGEVTLTVQAYDRNYHRDSVGGTREFGIEVDQDPATPARRQRINADQPRQEAAYAKADWGQAKWGDYPWHDADSIDVEFEDMEEGDFAYDRDGTGDDTHVLLFDKTPPKAEFTIRTGQ